MEFFKENTINGLKEIIKYCQLAENILRNSALDSDTKTFRKMFLYYADLNSSYIKKLQSEILRLGGNIEDPPIDNFYYWGDQTDYKEKLKICENSVNNAVTNYRKFSLREDILNEVIPVISQQYFGEKEAQETIRNINIKELAV
jgi:hypothetical protein